MTTQPDHDDNTLDLDALDAALAADAAEDAISFIVKIHHRSYGVISRRFKTRDEAYVAFRAALDPTWHERVSMSFGPNGFDLNVWQADAC